MDKQGLIDMYKRGIDFCFRNQYPSNEFIKDNFDRQLLIENAMFIDESIDEFNSPSPCILLGSTSGKLSFDKFSSCDIYLRDNVDIEISAKDFSRVFINVYGSAKVRVVQDGVAKIYVYKHGDHCKVSNEGDVLIRIGEDY
ncbi:hypothetical protein JCM10512_1603 [Bacteroides reticulotermitis JCM 10512]|uniref:Uncharacterized protein n=2 Tax=Bacteroides reticulotermitis TaxID=1133319 RepID=W4URB6_9BACE|nr:hypothetical protein JCM10512_1603 [Bacteroides reticulotermitis JCM 10512]